MKENAIVSLAHAETTLLDALGQQHWQAPEALTYERPSREVFAAGRLNAEYFHPAKADAQARLRSVASKTIGDYFVPVRSLWSPEEDALGDWVRNYNLTDALSPFLDTDKPPVHRDQISSIKKEIQAGDLVVSRLRSYLKEIAIVRNSRKWPMVASTEYSVLRPVNQSAPPIEAILVYLRSVLPQTVFKWSQDGSNHPRFDQEELLALPVPQEIIDNAAFYVDCVQEMIRKRERATQLLEAAKRAVEIAIEDSEAAAIAHIDTIQ